MAEISELEAHKQERDVILTFDEDIGLALSQASDYSDAIILAKVAKILRRHMLDHTSMFDGTFHDGCIEEAIPSSLVQFVGMIEHGADIKSQLRFDVSKTDLVIAQLLQYNCYAKYKEGAATHRHSTNRETPFPIFLGMSVYAKTRKRMLVEMLHEHGISISYARVLEVSAQLGDASVSKYMKDGVVCPATDVNNARLDMFARKQRPYQAIPPTQSALLQHVTLAAYQAGCVWSQSTLRQPETQSPADWGWAKNGDLWNVVWTTLPPFVESCQQLTKCGCKSDCHGRCKCYRRGLSCIALCSCRYET